MEKKVNLSMRIGVIALIVALISLVGISGTFAKYTTGNSTSETARVAKWGITVSGDADPVFKTSYIVGTNTIAASTNGTDKIFAPGLKNSKNLLGSVTGTPEVAFQLAATVNTATYSNIPTTGDAANYYPLTFKVKVGEGAEQSFVATSADFKTALQSALDTALGDAKFYPGSAITIPSVTLSWEWPFSTNAEQDKKDTILGNLTTAPIITLDVTVSATQINS